MGRFAQIACLLALGLGPTSCVWGPFRDDTIPSTTSLVTFDLLAVTSGATVTAECATHYSGFSQFASKVATTTVPVNGDNLYLATIKNVIPARCWDFGFDQPVTWLRFYQKKDGKTYQLYVFDQTGVDCVNDALAERTGAIAAGQRCGEAGQLRLFANY